MLLNEVDFFTRIMEEIKKAYIKIINIVIAGIVIINTATYGYALSDQFFLRVPLVTTTEEGKSRLYKGKTSILRNQPTAEVGNSLKFGNYPDVEGKIKISKPSIEIPLKNMFNFETQKEDFMAFINREVGIDLRRINGFIGELINNAWRGVGARDENMVKCEASFYEREKILKIIIYQSKIKKEDWERLVNNWNDYNQNGMNWLSNKDREHNKDFSINYGSGLRMFSEIIGEHKGLLTYVKEAGSLKTIFCLELSTEANNDDAVHLSKAEENAAFDKNYIAINNEGKRKAIEFYQKAINEVINCINEISVKDDFPAIKITDVRGSFAGIKTSMPRLGIYTDETLENAKMFALKKQGPSDIDFVAPIYKYTGKQYSDLQDEMDRITEDIFYKYGVLAHFWLYKPNAGIGVISIAELLGNGLVNLYSNLFQSKSSFGSIVNAIDDFSVTRICQ